MGRLSLRLGTMSHGREATKRRNAQQMSESWPFESWRDVTVPLTDATNRDPDITFGDFDDEDDGDGGDAARSTVSANPTKTYQSTGALTLTFCSDGSDSTKMT